MGGFLERIIFYWSFERTWFSIRRCRRILEIWPVRSERQHLKDGVSKTIL